MRLEGPAVGVEDGAERPEFETFGENVGILTREVFGLEVSHSGFHKMLRDAAAAGETYEEIVARFGGELGGEARAISLCANNNETNPCREFSLEG